MLKPSWCPLPPSGLDHFWDPDSICGAWLLQLNVTSLFDLQKCIWSTSIHLNCCQTHLYINSQALWPVSAFSCLSLLFSRGPWWNISWDFTIIAFTYVDRSFYSVPLSLGTVKGRLVLFCLVVILPAGLSEPSLLHLMIVENGMYPYFPWYKWTSLLYRLYAYVFIIKRIDHMAINMQYCELFARSTLQIQLLHKSNQHSVPCHQLATADVVHNGG